MTWGLYNHNYLAQAEGASVTVPEAPAVQPLNEVNTALDLGSDRSSLTRGGIVADGVGLKAMWFKNLASEIAIAVTLDGGETWEDKTNGIGAALSPDANAYNISAVYYDAVSDAWYAQAYRSSSTPTVFFYSDDDGDTWTEMVLDDYDPNDPELGRSFIWDGENLYTTLAQSDSTNNNNVYKAGPLGDSPSKLTGLPRSTYFQSQELGENYYITENLLGTSRRFLVAAKDLSGFTRPTLSWPVADDARFSPSSGDRWFMPAGYGQTAGNGTDLEIKQFGSGADLNDTFANLPIVELTFPVDVRIWDVGYHPDGGFVVCAFETENAASGNTDMYVHYSQDGVSWSSEPIKVLLATDSHISAKGELAYLGDGTWYISYNAYGAGANGNQTDDFILGTFQVIDYASVVSGTNPEDQDIEVLHTYSGQVVTDPFDSDILSDEVAGTAMWLANSRVDPAVVSVTTDGGNTFTDVPNNLEALLDGFFTPVITGTAFDIANKIFYLVAYSVNEGDSDYCYSDDGGATWVRMGSNLSEACSHGLGIIVDGTSPVISGQQGSAFNRMIAKGPIRGSSWNEENHTFLNNRARGMVKMDGKYYVVESSKATDSDMHLMRINSDMSGGYSDLAIKWDQDVRGGKISNSDDSQFFLIPPVTGSIITVVRFTPDTNFAVESPTLDEVSFSFPEPVKVWDIAYSSIGGWLLIASSTAGGKRALYAHWSEDGVNWSGVPVTLTIPDDDPALEDNCTARIAYLGEGRYWYLSYRSAGSVKSVLAKIFIPFGSTDLVYSEMKSVVNAQAPDIFYLMDDEQSATSVEDIGRRGWANSIEGSIAFGVTGLVSVGKAALFSGGRVPITPKIPASTNHAHLFILRHDGADSDRVLLDSSGNFTITLTSDGKVEYSAGDTTAETDVAIGENEKTLLLVVLRRTGSESGDLSIYIDGERELNVTADMPISTAAEQALGALFGGGSPATGVTIDYYAQIPFENLDVGKILDAWSGEKPEAVPTPPEPEYPGAPGLRCVARFDAAPASVRRLNQSLGRYVDYLSYGNAVADGGEVLSWASSNVRDVTESMFGASSALIPANLYSNTFPPFTSPFWLGFQDSDLGTRDFTLQMRIHPQSSQLVYPFSSVAMLRVGDRYYLFTGIQATLTGTANDAALRLFIGKSRQDALEGSGRSWESKIYFEGFPSYNLAGQNFLTVSRFGGTFYATLNGKRAANKVVTGAEAAPILRDPSWKGLLLGSNIGVASRFVGVQRLTVSPARPNGRWVQAQTELARACNIDEFVFILDKAYYLDEFEPPTVPFDTQPGGASPTLDTPTGTQTGATTADGTVETDKNSGTLYAVITESATPPSETDIKSGTAAVYSTSQAIDGAGEQSAAATGLTGSTGYYWHYYQEDTAGNGSNVATSAEFTTTAS